MFDLLVCGGRYYDDYAMMASVLDRETRNYEFEEVRIITGTELDPKIPFERIFGADLLAVYWARAHNVRCLIVEPDWDKYGRAAGPRRNSEMLKKSPDMVIAFPGGDGTADTVRKAINLGIPVKNIDD